MYINEYLAHLKKEKKMTENTIEAYKRDMLHFVQFINSRGIDSVKDIGNAEIVGYVIELKNKNRSASTINRKLASLRSYFRYNLSKGRISTNPTEGIKTPKMQKKDIVYLTIEEMDNVLAIPDDTVKGKRDKAILELMYATGLRVSELIEIKVQDINLRIGFLSCYAPGSKP
ncbi:MAG: site-specific integrase, partial [Eubacteriales bacterium]|nr:site-specific integrase [Eubacteriales bacterium]